MKKLLRNILSKFGYEVLKTSRLVVDDMRDDKEFYALYEKCKPYTMTTPERQYALYKAVEYVVKNNIEGDFVECGVWRGGSSMFMAYGLQQFGGNTQQLYMYDTYEGMSEPTDDDVDITGARADVMMKNSLKEEASSVWCYADLTDVKQNMALTKFSESRITYVKGKVEDTIPATMPEKISILRLDTDWFESTKHELVHLYPRLAKGGVLILDDYGYWKGNKKAVDEYFAERNEFVLLNRLDYGGRLAVKVA